MSPTETNLRALRDELRLKMHLAKMDLKDEWQKLEPQLDHVLSNVAIVTGEVMADLQKRMEELQKRLS